VSPELLIEPPVEAEAPAADVEALMEEARRRQRKRRILFAAVVLVGAALAAGIYFAFVRGDRSLTGADVPRPAATFHKGWIFHQRRELTMVPYAGAGHYVHLVTESWKETSPPYRSRDLTYPAYWAGTRVEMGASGRERYAYDPLSKTIYESSSASAGSFADPAARNRQMIESGRWKVAKRTTIDGRPVMRIDNAIPTVVYYVDAQTYELVRIESQGYPLKQRGTPKPPTCSYSISPETPATKTVDKLLTYEYLPPTKANEKLLDIQKQHPSAPTAPAKSMPKQFKSVVDPPGCGRPPAP
jgi:hypothetical protein